MTQEEIQDIEDEFTVNPDYSGEDDDREIPDDDEPIDIMSATTPLSRKETAKLIATGKTAPLPLDEDLGALSRVPVLSYMEDMTLRCKAVSEREPDLQRNRRNCFLTLFRCAE